MHHHWDASACCSVRLFARLSQGCSRQCIHLNVRQGGGVEGSQLPLLATELSASDAFQEISRIAPDILPSSARKIEESKVRCPASRM